MKNNVKRITVLLVAILLISSTVISAFAATVYYYFGFLYTYINNEKVSLYGINDEDFDGLFVPDTLNNRDLVDIRNNAFMDNTDIRYVEFSGATKLERIGSFAFKGCTSVNGEIKIPANVVIIETAAFEGCTSLDTVVYNSTCGYVPNQCFNGCTELSTVILNDTVENIGNYAFSNCPNLEYMELGRNITSIDKSAFSNDENLILGVYKDTYAHSYAAEKQIPYILLDGPKSGDANGDGMVDILDSTEIQKFAAESTVFTDEQFELADINDDGFVDVIDALLVQKYVVGEYDIPPIIYNS